VSEPEEVLAGLGEVIDLGQPCGVLFGATLSHMSAGDARGAVAGFARHLAPGSAVAVSCASFADPDVAARMAGLFGGETGAAWRNHSAEDIGGFFAGAGLRVVRGQAGDVHAWPLLCDGRERGAVVLGGVGLKD
jgi:hypothetical protein